MDSLRGKLVVAAPTLTDPNFARSVVLITEHTEDGGAMGVVLNRPSEMPVDEAIPELAEVAGPDAPVFVGGPVNVSALIVLADFRDRSAAALIVVADVGLVSAETETESLPGLVRRARVFAGYSGWSPGQLEQELEEEESWIVEAPIPAEMFPDDPTTLWEAVLRRKGGRWAMLATMPTDPSVN